MDTNTLGGVRRQRAGGWAALCLALAYLAAMPYYLLVVDYPGATTAADKVTLIVGHYGSLYAMEFVTYVVVGLTLGVLAFALYDRLRAGAPFAARLAVAAGLLWAFALVASGLVLTYGITTVETLAQTDRAQAESVWQAIEPVALGLGGAGGEILGGLWVLLVSWVALQDRVLPRALGWLGVAIGAVGLASVVPPLHDLAYAFGLLQIVWFVWLGVVLMTTKPVATAATRPHGELGATASATSGRRFHPVPGALDA
jgi:hypothetical protein